MKIYERKKLGMITIPKVDFKLLNLLANCLRFIYQECFALFPRPELVSG